MSSSASQLLNGKRVLIMGVANDFSIGWGVAKICHLHGAKLAFSAQSEATLKRVRALATQVGSEMVFECDVSQPNAVEKLFDAISADWSDGIDGIVHSIAFADKAELRGHFTNTTRENFLNSMNVSCFSFIELCKHARRMMRNSGSILTMSYYGAEKVIKNYNVMGIVKAALEASVRYAAYDLGEENIRINAISAGPIKTLAASGIADLQSMLSTAANNSPLRRGSTVEDVGGAAVYFLSDLSCGTTGEIMHVDCGYNVLGMNMTSN